MSAKRAVLRQFLPRDNSPVTTDANDPTPVRPSSKLSRRFSPKRVTPPRRRLVAATRAPSGGAPVHPGNESLLARVPPLDNLLQLQLALSELQAMEQQVDTSALKYRFLSGDAFVRGVDRACGRPVVWVRFGRRSRGLSQNRHAEYLLPVLWAFLLALARRPDGVRDIAVFVDNGAEGTGVRDADFELNDTLLKWCSKMRSAWPTTGPVFMLRRSPSTRILVKSATALWPELSHQIRWLSKRSEILEVVRNPDDVPLGLVPGKGKEFVPCNETLGCFELLLERQAFVAMDVSQFSVPSSTETPFRERLNGVYKAVRSPKPRQQKFTRSWMKTARQELERRSLNSIEEE